jgi:hypothetical protein
LVFIVVQIREARWYHGKGISREEPLKNRREHNGLVDFGDRNGYREYAGRVVTRRISDLDSDYQTSKNKMGGRSVKG